MCYWNHIIIIRVVKKKRGVRIFKKKQAFIEQLKYSLLLIKKILSSKF